MFFVPLVSLLVVSIADKDMGDMSGSLTFLEILAVLLVSLL